MRSIWHKTGTMSPDSRRLEAALALAQGSSKVRSTLFLGEELKWANPLLRGAALGHAVNFLMICPQRPVRVKPTTSVAQRSTILVCAGSKPSRLKGCSACDDQIRDISRSFRYGDVVLL